EPPRPTLNDGSPEAIRARAEYNLVLVRNFEAARLLSRQLERGTVSASTLSADALEAVQRHRSGSGPQFCRIRCADIQYNCCIHCARILCKSLLDLRRDSTTSRSTSPSSPSSPSSSAQPKLKPAN